jgi:mannose/cellobiose epimerase-like protein (N-acyl-D-glucosamine 2-epimerase family)
MHLLEAFLAAHEATGGEEMLHKAGSIVDLFRNHFFCSGMLCEYFDDNFAPLPSPAFVEPGHHLEWVWLLSHYARAAGQDVTDLIQALYRPAMQFGAEPQSGLIYNRIAGDGAVVDAAKRLWPQTEQVKAQRALGRPGAEAMLDVIFRHFLEPASPGAWADRLDAHNNPLPGTVPASSLYHLFQAFAAIDQTP